MTKHAVNYIEWNFFATSHGKGAIDGVGGTAKRMAWNLVKSRQVHISNASEFVNALNAHASKITFIFIDNLTVTYTSHFEQVMRRASKVIIN